MIEEALANLIRGRLPAVRGGVIDGDAAGYHYYWVTGRFNAGGWVLITCSALGWPGIGVLDLRQFAGWCPVAPADGVSLLAGPSWVVSGFFDVWPVGCGEAPSAYGGCSRQLLLPPSGLGYWRWPRRM